MTNNQYTRITVPLSREEFDALAYAAGSGYRHPRDQARYLLRGALGLSGPPPPVTGSKNGETGAAVIEAAAGSANK